MLMQVEKMVFCTLFDSNYLDKGLALYHSMSKQIDIFKLYIFAFDDRCYDILKEMCLENTVILSLEDIMTERLRQIQSERTRAEFCWTCSPIIIEYVLQKKKEKVCTYIDADIYFFSNPEEIIQEIADSNCSVGLVEHRFERNYEYGKHVFRVGKYCIQFNTFFNDCSGMQVLTDWKKRCLEWCYYRCEDGKLGDQKYPDKWRRKFTCIHEAKALGAGVAPWNLHLYSYKERKDSEIWMESNGRKFRLIFYHFEGMKYLSDGRVFLNLWNPCAPGMRKKLFYGEYLSVISSVRKFLANEHSITFEQMLMDRDTFLKGKYTLKNFYDKNGLLDGIEKWAGFWLRNIVSSDKRWMRKG